MMRLAQFTALLVVMLMLTACSTTADRSRPAETVMIESESAQTTDEQIHFENGLGETQIERYEIVILPSQITLTTENTLPITVQALSNTLTHALTSALYQTHRFNILSNEDPTAELSNDVVTQRENSDFYLQSTLNQLDTQQTIRVLKATGQTVEQQTVIATISYQIIDAKSQKNVFSHSLTYKLNSTPSGETFATTINNTLISMANLIQRAIISEIYPLRVLAIQNNHITLDSPLTVGSLCEVMQLGKKVKDSYTDSLLGYEQNIIGKLLITRTTGVLSYGELIDGHANQGDICKPLSAASLSAPELIKQTSQGGIIAF